MKKILLSSLLAVMAVTSANAKIASTNYVDEVAQAKADAAQSAAAADATSKANAAQAAAKSYADGLTGDVVNSNYIKGLTDKTLTGAVEDLDSRVEGLTGTGDQAAATNKELADGLAKKLDKDQGVSNAGKGLIVDTTGNLALADVATDAELNIVSGVANNAKTIAEGAVDVNTQQGTDISNNTDAINNINNGAVMKSGITAAKVAIYDGYATGKQNTLSDTQLAAVNSGITAARVNKYEGYATGKQNTLSDTQLAAVNSGITAAKVDTYDGYATGKQNTLSDTQLAAVNSGISRDRLAIYDAYDARISENYANINPITSATVAEEGKEDGQYVLTKKVVGGVTSYSWELIDRALAN